MAGSKLREETLILGTVIPRAAATEYQSRALVRGAENLLFFYHNEQQIPRSATPIIQDPRFIGALRGMTVQRGFGIR